MENNKNLFDVQVDDATRVHLKEAAVWARFLAISGIILLGMGLLTVLTVVITAPNGTNGPEKAELLGSITAFIIIGGLVYFFPCLFLLRFARKMLAAMNAGDNTMMTESFRNLKITFRYVGIIFAFALAFAVIGFLGVLFFAPGL